MGLKIDFWPDVGYCDGGLIGANGRLTTTIGTIACALGVWKDGLPGGEVQILASSQRTVTAQQMRTHDMGELSRRNITNNDSEFAALMLLLAKLPSGWTGPIVCDSEVTLRRIRRVMAGGKVDSLHPEIQRRALVLVRKLGHIKWVQIDGHQDHSKEWMHVGNCLCDRMCNGLRDIIKNGWEHEKEQAETQEATGTAPATG